MSKNIIPRLAVLCWILINAIVILLSFAEGRTCYSLRRKRLVLSSHFVLIRTRLKAWKSDCALARKWI